MGGPHEGQPVATAGLPAEDADVGAVLLHGRGATAQGILGLAAELDRPGVAYRAPQAAERTWYPNSFMADISSNEPWLSSALATLDGTLAGFEAAGIPRERVVLVGFSQGACLASEYVARNATRYGGLAALSGGLIGPAGTPREYEGSLDGTPAFLGCSDVDPHIPVERVHETRDVLDGLGAEVDERIYEGMGHTVTADELDAVGGLLADLVGPDGTDD